MQPQNKLCRILTPVLLILSAAGQAALGQQETAKPQSADEILKINTELVQTAVTVFDKQGHFVEGLKKEEFELRVDGRLVPISDRSGILGSAMQWIVIPALSTHQLALSSLILGLENVTNKSAEAGGIQWSVDKKFVQNSRLKFMTFIYNSAQPVSNNLSVRVQVYKDGQAVISTPFKTVVPDRQADPERVPFNAEINLAGLQGGRYILEVTVEDRASQRTASQHTAFYVH